MYAQHADFTYQYIQQSLTLETNKLVFSSISEKEVGFDQRVTRYLLFVGRTGSKMATLESIIIWQISIHIAI